MRTKLVRDKIPDIIKNSGKKPVFRKAKRDEIHLLLFDKAIEEIGEFNQDPSVEEAADVLEVLRALCRFHKIRMEDVEKAADKKKLERGGFKKGIVLEDVHE